MWHPEREKRFKNQDLDLFRSFFVTDIVILAFLVKVVDFIHLQKIYQNVCWILKVNQF